MFKYIIERAGNIDWMAIIPMIIFVVIFTLVIIYAFFNKKTDFDSIAQIPLEDNDDNEDSNQ